jgi:hypothetical protein
VFGGVATAQALSTSMVIGLALAAGAVYISLILVLVSERASPTR